jgi:hypothetical protein
MDRIENVPAAQQRTISRSDFADDWPFVPGTGTLGCAEGAVAFRAQGVTYGLNDAARARGYVRPDGILVTQSAAPSNPLGRLRQDERMQMFAASQACESTADPSACKQRLSQSHRVSGDELVQIETEGRERSWPPLSPRPRSLASVLRAGSKMCGG